MLIAHPKNEDGTNEDQSLWEHLNNVSLYMTDTLKNCNFVNIGKIIAYLHDLGKANKKWQEWIVDNSKFHPNHSQYGRIAYNKEIFPDELLTSIYEKYEIKIPSYMSVGQNIYAYRWLICNVICSHHNHLKNARSLADVNFLLEKEKESEAQQNSNNDVQALRYLFNEKDAIIGEIKQLQELFIAGFEEYIAFICKAEEHLNKIKTIDNIVLGEAEKEKRIRFFQSLLQILVLSALNDADVLDTQRHHDGEEFKLDEIPDWNKYKEEFEKSISSLAPQKGEEQSKLNQVRTEISNACKECGSQCDENNMIERLSVFVGGGKTLASTRYALYYAITNKRNRIFFIIPFTAILDQNADVIRKSLGGIERNNFDAVLEHHSNFQINENDDDLDNEIQELFYADAIERYESDIVLTTLVQFLNAPYSYKRHSNRLFCRYIDSIVIIDEFQSVPEHCIDMFYLLCDFMALYMNTKVILCSATQSSSLNYPIDTKLLADEDYVEKYRDLVRRTRLIDKTGTIDPNNKVSNIFDVLVDIIDDTNSVLTVVNTKAEAVNEYRKLDDWLSIRMNKDEYDIFHLSTSMYPKHRKKVLKEVFKSLEDPTKKTFCIATTVIEAGVDISFDNVIRFESGLDHVIQAAGRCNRNQEKEDLADVYIINTNDGKKNRNKMWKNQCNAYARSLAGCTMDDNIEIAGEKYFEEYQRMMNAKEKISSNMIEVDGKKVSIVSLLSDNPYLKPPSAENDLLAALTGGVSNGSSEDKKKYSLAMIQSAQQNFEVIKELDQFSLVVNKTEESEKLLQQFGEVKTYKELSKIEKKLQDYSINVYTTFGTIKQLSGYIEEIENPYFRKKISFISECCYDEQLGIVIPQVEDFIL